MSTFTLELKFKEMKENPPEFTATGFSTPCVLALIDGNVEVGHFHVNGYFYSTSDDRGKLIARWTDKVSTPLSMKLPMVSAWREIPKRRKKK